MRKIKLIYNSFSGNHNFVYDLDECVGILQNGGYEVSLFRTMEKGDIYKHLMAINKEDYYAYIISGGDGTINIMINAMIKAGLQDKPLGIIPSGTANDFASFLMLPKNPAECCEIICKNNIKTIDIGKVNNRYFINVCAGGLFANVSSNIDKTLKSTLGKFAYYLKGIERIPTFEPMKMRITNSKEIIEDSLNLFLVLNSSGTGGIENLAPGATIDDGLFDFIGFRGDSLSKISILMVKYLKGEYLEDNRIIYFKDKYIKIENLSSNTKFSKTDLDGEEGPSMPIEINNFHNAIRIFY